MVKPILREKVHQLVKEGFDHKFGHPTLEIKPDPEWKKLRDIGTRLWLDTGDMEEAGTLFTAEFDALTTNNTLLNKEVQKGIYDGLVGQAAKVIQDADPSISERDLLLEIAFVLNARHGLNLVHRFDSLVSVELHTDLSMDVERSIEYGERYFEICPERFVIKIPLTPAGFFSARALSEKKIPVNYTLGFSARQNYLAAVFSNPAFVNVFMGRLGVFLIENKLGSGAGIGEKATLATQRELLKLRQAGQAQSHLIGASMRLGEQVATLAGLDVYTMPPKVAADYRKNPKASLENHVHDDPEVPLAEGVSPEDINLESVWKVSDPFKECVASLVGENISEITPESLKQHFDQNGFGDLFPSWSADEISTITKDGKIPVYKTWEKQLKSGKYGLDALMNISALYSFVTDQMALDNRVKSLLE